MLGKMFTMKLLLDPDFNLIKIKIQAKIIKFLVLKSAHLYSNKQYLFKSSKVLLLISTCNYINKEMVHILNIYK